VQHRPLGSTGESVSVVAFGTGSLGEMYGPLDSVDAVRLVHQVVDAGITVIDTSPYYGSAEDRLGKALDPARRDRVFLCTKAGRYGFDDFDFTPARIRRSLDESLRRLRTDRVDALQLHDIEFRPLGPIFEDGMAELLALRAEGKCRFVGMTGYPVATLARVMRETDVDVILTHSKDTLLDSALTDELAPIARERGVGVMNAAALAVGLLSPGGSRVQFDHPAGAEVQRAALAMRELAAARGADIAFIANQFAIQRTAAATTVIGAGRWPHVESAIRAAASPIDESLLEDLLALRPAAGARGWSLGLVENR
jgi:L-galactose dehydrogenase